MPVALPRPMTREQFLAWEEKQFLAWEEKQPLRYEFDGFQPVAMTGGTAAHAGIQRNLAIAVGGWLRAGPCRFYGSDLKIETANGFRYPDGFVVCSPVARNATVVRDPVVIFEVLSESTAGIDLVTKNQEYSASPSVQRYIVLTQDAVGGTMFERVATDWVGHLLGADSVLRMPEIGIELPLAELYDGVDIATADAAQADSEGEPTTR
jgi:Uma2 family endonuclease